VPTLVIKLVQVLNVIYSIVQIPQRHRHQVITVKEWNLVPVQLYVLPLETFF